MEFSFLNMLLILLVGWLAGRIVTRLGYPSVLGELAAGIIFGPPLLNMIHGDAGITLLGRIGILMMMLFIGTRVSPRDLVKASGAALWATLGGFLLPFILGLLAILAFRGTTNAGLMVGTVISVTALATVPRIVVDLKLVETRIGQTLMAVALFSVVVVLVAFSAVTGIVEAGGVRLGEVLLVVAKSVLFIILVTALGMYGFPVIGDLMGRANLTGRTDDLTFAILIASAVAFLAELFGLSFILGAFLAGLFLREEMFEKGVFTDLLTVVRDVALGFLAPIFFVSAGFRVSFEVFRTNPLLVVVIVLVALVGKVAGGVLAYRLTGRSWREGFVVGLGMNGRGGVDIIMAGVGLELGVISRDIFTALVVTTFITTLSAPILLKLGADWLRRRGELIAAGPSPAPAPQPAPVPTTAS